jgi:hypothetical protein
VGIEKLWGRVAEGTGSRFAFWPFIGSNFEFFFQFFFSGVVQSDQRRPGRVRVGRRNRAVPTARVHRKEPVNLKGRYHFSFILG